MGMGLGVREEVDFMRRRARGFLEAADYMLTHGLYDLAAFNSEQASQLYLKATLLELVGDYPRTHSVIALLKELRRMDEGVEEFIAENREGLHFLEDSYLTSRYFLKVFDEEDGRYLASLASKVVELCDRVRSRRGLGEG
ncbi:MAG: HEPN domain-containing protein [Candidatus Bathyarchaeia archaeon]